MGDPEDALHRAWRLNTSLEEAVTQVTAQRDQAEALLNQTVRERDALQEQVKSMTAGFQDAMSRLTTLEKETADVQNAMEPLAALLGKSLLLSLSPSQPGEQTELVTLNILWGDRTVYASAVSLTALQERELEAALQALDSGDGPFTVMMEK